MSDENKPVGLGATGSTGHLTFNKKVCPKCGAGPEHHEVRNWNELWRDGDVHCMKCGEYVRMYDAG